MPEIRQWGEIKNAYQDGALLLGNGASMAVHPGFGYSSLREAAAANNRITKAVADVFTAFDTNDFELVLRRLWHAKLVNQALGVEPGKVEEAYRQVREALIATVRDIHISFDEAQPHLKAIYGFMQSFKTVLSLNYDLLVYWSMMASKDSLGNWFKDCFQQGGVFREDWETLRQPYGATGSTLVFYPHGNLITARKNDYSEQKLSAAGGDAVGLLNRLLEQWKHEEVVPLFVSEGTSDHKKLAIINSDYLSRVFREVIPRVSPSLVIYGWSVSDQDEHILEQLKLARPGLVRLAISVLYHNQVDVERMETKLSTLGVPELVFFDAQSPGCWVHPL